eukprot:1002364_1
MKTIPNLGSFVDQNIRSAACHGMTRLKPTCPTSLSGHNMKDIGVALKTNYTLTAEEAVAAGQECIVARMETGTHMELPVGILAMTFLLLEASLGRPQAEQTAPFA